MDENTLRAVNRVDDHLKDFIKQNEDRWERLFERMTQVELNREAIDRHDERLVKLEEAEGEKLKNRLKVGGAGALGGFGLNELVEFLKGTFGAGGG